MATPAHSVDEYAANCRTHTWALTTADHTGAWLELPGASDRSIQFDGTWGGATAILEGSNGPTGTPVALPLTDPSSTAISKTADGIEAVLENVRFIRPRLSVVGAGATVNCRLMSKGQR